MYFHPLQLPSTEMGIHCGHNRYVAPVWRMRSSHFADKHSPHFSWKVVLWSGLKYSQIQWEDIMIGKSICSAISGRWDLHCPYAFVICIDMPFQRTVVSVCSRPFSCFKEKLLNLSACEAWTLGLVLSNPFALYKNTFSMRCYIATLRPMESFFFFRTPLLCHRSLYALQVINGWM